MLLRICQRRFEEQCWWWRAISLRRNKCRQCQMCLRCVSVGWCLLLAMRNPLIQFRLIFYSGTSWYQEEFWASLGHRSKSLKFQLSAIIWRKCGKIKFTASVPSCASCSAFGVTLSKHSFIAVPFLSPCWTPWFSFYGEKYFIIALYVSIRSSKNSLKLNFLFSRAKLMIRFPFLFDLTFLTKNIAFRIRLSRDGI